VTEALACTPYSAPQKPIWDLVPPVAPYGRIAPTTFDISRLPGKCVRSIEITTSFISAVADLAISTGVEWVAAAMEKQAEQTQRVMDALVDTTEPAVSRILTAPVAIRGKTTATYVSDLRHEIQHRSGLSRKEIARLVGVDRRSLSGWVSGGTPPTPSHLSRLQVLAAVTRQLNRVHVTELDVIMRDGETAAALASAIRAENVDRAVSAVLGSAEEDLESPTEPLSPGQLDALRRLAAAVEVADSQPDEDNSDRAEDVRRELRIRLDRRAYATPRRPRWSSPGE
jgi:transcriptional regulator with XRE-family HTH domain